MKRILATAAALALLAGPVQAAIVGFNNGFFEVVDDRQGTEADQSRLNTLAGSSGAASWDVYDSLPGGWFNAPLAPPGTATGTGIEVQTKNTIGLTPHSGDHYIELDSDEPGSTKQGDTNSRMAQNFAVTTDAVLQLLFWYSPRKNQQGTNGILFDIVDESGTSVLDPAGPDSIDGPQPGPPETVVGQWTPISALTSTIGPGTYTVFFQAFGTEETEGGFIDTVILRGKGDPGFGTNAVPLPAPALLLLAGLGTFALMRRRQVT